MKPPHHADPTHAMLIKAALPPYRKERLITWRTKVRYWRGRTGKVAHREKSRHCMAVMNRESAADRTSASCSVSPGRCRGQVEILTPGGARAQGAG